MRHIVTIAAFLLVGGLAGSTAAVASTPAAAAAQVAQQAPTTSTRTHSVRGIVESVNATSLIIARTSRKPNDLSFVLTPSTLREGTILVGSTVSVRYRTEGDTLVATAVVARRSPAAK